MLINMAVNKTTKITTRKNVLPYKNMAASTVTSMVRLYVFLVFVFGVVHAIVLAAEQYQWCLKMLANENDTPILNNNSNTLKNLNYPQDFRYKFLIVFIINFKEFNSVQLILIRLGRNKRQHQRDKTFEIVLYSYYILCELHSISFFVWFYSIHRFFVMVLSF